MKMTNCNKTSDKKDNRNKRKLDVTKPSDGKDGGIGNTKGGNMSHRPHNGLNLTPNRERRLTDLAIKYFDHDMRGSPCLTATAAYFGARSRLHFMHFNNDFIRAVRKAGWTLRQRTTVLRRNEYTVDQYLNHINGEISATVTKQLSLNGEMPDHLVFWVKTEDYADNGGITHIFATDFFGTVGVDTARHTGATDDREVIQVWGVWG